MEPGQLAPNPPLLVWSDDISLSLHIKALKSGAVQTPTSKAIVTQHIALPLESHTSTTRVKGSLCGLSCAQEAKHMSSFCAPTPDELEISETVSLSSVSKYKICISSQGVNSQLVNK